MGLVKMDHARHTPTPCPARHLSVVCGSTPALVGSKDTQAKGAAGAKANGGEVQAADAGAVAVDLRPELPPKKVTTAPGLCGGEAAPQPAVGSPAAPPSALTTGEA